MNEEESLNKKRQIMKLYDSSARIYNRRYNMIQSRKYKFVEKLLEGKEIILDVGCGTGLLSSFLDEKASLLIGVDISVNMLKVAQGNPKRRLIREDLIRADADWLPFRDNVFEKVISVTVLQNMPEPRVTIKDIARVTVAGGEIAVTSLRKKHDLANLLAIILISAPELKVTTEWDDDDEDAGAILTKLI
ncbi:MAG: class I SAM-dependent methyltransferase [Candidatus Atabeyarchaeum deiterrae]